jgi:hypothetical protein
MISPPGCPTFCQRGDAEQADRHRPEHRRAHGEIARRLGDEQAGGQQTRARCGRGDPAWAALMAALGADPGYRGTHDPRWLNGRCHGRGVDRYVEGMVGWPPMATAISRSALWVSRRTFSTCAKFTRLTMPPSGRLFDNLVGEHIERAPIRVVASARVTHLRFRFDESRSGR